MFVHTTLRTNWKGSTSDWTEPKEGPKAKKQSRAGSPGSKTPGDSRTPEPSTTNNGWPSWARKSDESRDSTPTGGVRKMLQLQRKTLQIRLEILIELCRSTDLRHLRLSLGTAGACRSVFTRTSVRTAPVESLRFSAQSLLHKRRFRALCR